MIFLFNTVGCKLVLLSRPDGCRCMKSVAVQDLNKQ